ncbi:MAG: ion transporter [Gomphosphaeria aponina SAG 52.96 = DSM 107014]|uniref:Ion transporter n=1 Tax=Gomphosphaeria aponina SAG 52.96 = DSM 107014 TaxID=1521640 RepID=A0A941GPG2_9CHRO|nr:ion transporter [Gomphosphaeria aponina SAG 52.96 = DSM 107014]
MHQRLKRQLYTIFEESDPDNFFCVIDDILLSLLIAIDVIAFILQTSEELSTLYGNVFQEIEFFTVAAFTIEYVLRLWVCNVDPQYRHWFWGRVKYALTPIAIIDLLAILPFYLLLLFDTFGLITSPLIFSIFRIFRLLRLLKISRYSDAVKILWKALLASFEELTLTFFAVVILLVVASSLMFLAEHDAQPEAFPDIVGSMWWGIITLTTVGYGDVYPITPLGKILAGGLAFLGIGMFALPAGILASNFSEEIRKQRIEKPQKDNLKGKEETISLDSLPHIWTVAEKRNITIKVKQNAKLLKHCLEIAREELGDMVESEESVRSLAMLLYLTTFKD